MAAITPPREYQAGHQLARALDQDLADRYVRHTLIGDPEVDEMLAELDGHGAALKHGWIQRGIEGGADAIPDAPACARELFDRIAEVPSWWRPGDELPGCRAFHRHSQMFLGAFVAGVLVEGFSTLISKSFSITGRLTDSGVRRLKQNNRHLVEIFMPGGLDRQADGWKLSVRIRLVHGQLRRLLARSPEWDTEAWGVPLSSAHIAFATSAFSALLLKRATQLGVDLSPAERASFMQVWRYSGHLMGVSPELLFEDERSGLHLQRVGALCEPPPSLESCQLAGGLINAAPIVAGIEDPPTRRALVRKIYRISRALIGDERADQLRYPPARTLGTLPALRLAYRGDLLLQRLLPRWRGTRQLGQFAQLMDLSHYENRAMNYRVPDQVHAEKDGVL
ncbi:MAG: DUF2236 domain-containing protein [Ramlibacter sp.]|nr:DUF2236 domain-containing protein [Ramlibacter sp.]MCW5650903.1 DUF2236 domain-containing protein [Ramlibacter sp.]